MISLLSDSSCQKVKIEINYEILENMLYLSLIHISEPTRLGMISYAVFCLKKKKNNYETTRRTPISYAAFCLKKKNADNRNIDI